MADCSFVTPEGLSVCVSMAQRWTTTAGDIIGLGSLAVIGMLVAYLRHLRHRLTIELSTSQERLHRATNAETAQVQFDARIHERDAAIRELKDERQSLQEKIVLAQSAVHANADAAENNAYALEISNRGDTAFWIQPPLPLKESGLPLDLAVGCPTLLFANQKGGVGKTSCVASLAAYYACLGKNVLAVDLDYQGSLTNLMRLQQFGPPGTPPFQPQRDIKSVLGTPFHVEGWSGMALDDIINTAADRFPATEPLKGNLYYISADYELAQIERREEYAWVLKETSDDPRYRLVAFLKLLQAKFSLHYILIDAPPRFTMGFINGLCAASHLFVPTVVDGTSVRAVETFSIQFKDVRRALNPNLDWGGIIGMMTTTHNAAPHSLPNTLEQTAQSAENAARKRLGAEVGGFYFDAVVPRNSDISKATLLGVPFLQSEDIRNDGTFQNLGDTILRRVNGHEEDRTRASVTSDVAMHTG